MRTRWSCARLLTWHWSSASESNADGVAPNSSHSSLRTTDSDSDGAKSNLFSSDQTCRWCILSVTALWISLFWKISYLFYLRIHRWKMTRSREVLVIGWDHLSNFMFTFRFFCTCLLLECSNFVIVLLLLIAEGWLGLDLYFFSSWQRDGLFFFRYNLLLKRFKC